MRHGRCVRHARRSADPRASTPAQARHSAAAMRPAALLVPLLILSLSSGFAGDPQPVRPAAPTGGGSLSFVNARVTPDTRTVSLNESVRIEFTTMAREIPEVDIGVSIRQSIALSAGSQWRLVGDPVIKEFEKAKVVEVVVALAPRTTGKLDLPTIPMAWLKNGAQARFGPAITVEETIAAGGARRPLPPEVVGVAQVPWGAAFTDWRERVPGSSPGRTADGVETLRTSRGLELRFPGGVLAEAVLPPAPMTLEQTSEHFMNRWGVPQKIEAGSMTWVIGWTRIVAREQGGSTSLQVIRDDQMAREVSQRAKRAFTDALDGDNPLAPRIDAEAEVGKLMLRSASGAATR